MNCPAAELRGIKMNFYLINPDAKHRGILLIKTELVEVNGLEPMTSCVQGRRSPN